MRNQPSLSATGQQLRFDYPENKNWWLAALRLAFQQVVFSFRYLWYQLAPMTLRLKPARPTRRIRHLTVHKSDLLVINPLNFFIPAFALVTLIFFIFQISVLSKTPEIISYYSPLTELVATASESPLPSPLTLTSQDQQEVAFQDLTQTLSRNLELLRQQPLHQNLLINTALIYYQLHDEENYLRYLDLAKNINPNLEVFPTTVEN